MIFTLGGFLHLVSQRNFFRSFFWRPQKVPAATGQRQKNGTFQLKEMKGNSEPRDVSFFG